MHSFTLNSVILHHDTCAANDFAWITLTINLAETSPCTKDLRISDLNKVDLMLGAKSFDKLDVLRFSASLNQNAEVGLTLVKGLGTLAKTTSKTIVDKRILQDYLYTCSSTQYW